MKQPLNPALVGAFVVGAFFFGLIILVLAVAACASFGLIVWGVLYGLE